MEFDNVAVCQAMDICDLVVPTIIAERFAEGGFGTENIHAHNRSKIIDHTVIGVCCSGKLGWTISDKCVFEDPSARCRKCSPIEEQIKEIGSQAKKETGPDLSQFWKI